MSRIRLHQGVIGGGSGDGITQAELDAAIANHALAGDPHAVYQKESEKAQLSGYASLDGTGIVPAAELPASLTNSAFVNVRDHGVIGDNVADDTVAITSLISDVPAGTSLIFPSGTYLTDPWTVDKRLRFVGDGKNQTIIKAKATAAGDPLLNWSNSTLRPGCSIRGMGWDMSASPTIPAVYMHNVRNGVVDDVYFGPVAGTVAFQLDLAQGMTLSNIDVFNATQAAFKGTHASSSGNDFWNCFTDNTTATGVYGFLFDGGIDWWCIGCRAFRAPGVAFNLQYGFAWNYTTPNYNATPKLIACSADAIGDRTEDSASVAAAYFKGVGDGEVVDTFLGAYSLADGVSSPSVKLDDTRNMRFVTNRMGGKGVLFTGGASDVLSFIGNNFLFGTAGAPGMYRLDSQPTNVYEDGSFNDHYSADSPPLASDATKWRIATSGDTRKNIAWGNGPPSDGIFRTPPQPTTEYYDDLKSRLHVRNSSGIYPYAQLVAEQTFYLGASTDDLAVQSTTTKARLRGATSGLTYTQKSVVTDTADATSYATSAFAPTSGKDYLIFVENLRSSSPTAINSITHAAIGSLTELGTVLSSDGKARISVWKGRSTGTTSGALTVDFGGVTQSACAIRPYELSGDANDVSTFATVGNTKAGNSTVSPLTIAFGVEPIDHSVIGMAGQVGAAVTTVGSEYSELTVYDLNDSLGHYPGEVKKKNTPDGSFMFTFSGNGEVFGIAVKVLLPVATPTVSGFTGGVDGRVLTATNPSLQSSVTLKHNTGSSPANRLTLTGAVDYALGPGASLPFTYDGASSRWIAGSSPDVPVISGVGSPEGVITKPVGWAYLRADGGAGTTLYVKESGSGNTGWVGK